MRDCLPIGPLAALRLHWRGWAREHPAAAVALEILALVAVILLADWFLLTMGRDADGAEAGSEIRNPQSSIRNAVLPSPPRGEAGAGAGGPRPPAAHSLQIVDCRLQNARPEVWRVTAYCPCKKCCGKWADGRTASGTRVDHPLVAGPPEIPFGTVLDVPGYGRVRVEDRGGAIQGRRLDVLFPTHEEALAWGVRRLAVEGFPANPQSAIHNPQ